jgi:hydroxymethylpyrimidine kinase/phosphomethylpyrimidine kinase
MKRIVTIAGSDTEGGAGIQADVKAIAALGEHGMTVITALTAQNSMGVQAVYPIPLPFIEAQLDAVFADIGTDAVKTGMLWNAAIVRLVAKKLAAYRVRNLVVDPVFVATDGTLLLDQEGQNALREELLPLASLVTPNLPEAAALADMEVATTVEMQEAARRIRAYGAQACLVKGGHLSGDPVDILLDEEGYTEFPSERLGGADVHGTGCMLSAAIATELAKGVPLREAVQRGREFTRAGIKAAQIIGRGQKFFAPPLAKIPLLEDLTAEQATILAALQQAVTMLQGEAHIGGLIPEVSANLAYALPHAHTPEEVAAFPGRIVRVREAIATVHPPAFNASQHIASVILAVMQHDPSLRAAMNIAYAPAIIKACKEAGLSVLGFDRGKEPPEAQEQEGRSLAWGVEAVLEKADQVPDVIYDEGGWGKEPMIRVIGVDPEQVVQKVIAINRRYHGKDATR